MKTMLNILFFLWVGISSAQDHYAIVAQNDRITYNYPESAVITIIESNGAKKEFKKNEVLNLEGDYTLSIEVPWQTEPEIIKSGGKKLEIFVLPTNSKYETIDISKHDNNRYSSNKPVLKSKEITKSNQRKGAYNLRVVFSNDLIFKYEDGLVKAWQRGNEIEVTNHYLAQTPEGLLKLSFDPKDGEFWYVFDHQNN